jgi:hypothetical protein
VKQSPLEHVVIERHWKYAPPPWVLFNAIVNDREQWFAPLLGEIDPQCVKSHEPDLVVMRPWEPPIAAVELRLTSDGDFGSEMRLFAYSINRELSTDEQRRCKHRLGTIFGAKLRDWVDEPH